MTIIKWKTAGSGYGVRAEIERVEVLRETAKSVVLPYLKSERTERKQTDFHAYHDSWDEAHAFLTRKAQDRLESARYNLAQAQGLEGNVKGMKKPIDSPDASNENATA